MEQEPPGRRRRARILSDSIGAGLRQLWVELENEAVPDEFLNLLDAIDEQRQNGDGETPDEQAAPVRKP